MSVPVYAHIPNIDHYMYHIDRQRATETSCYGCSQDYGSRWPHGIMLAVITDRSGSEQETSHNDLTCIQQAMENLDNYYDEEE